ncbi:hypothetical protein GIB67_009464, partial [Kingdonia uniflora]
WCFISVSIVWCDSGETLDWPIGFRSSSGQIFFFWHSGGLGDRAVLFLCCVCDLGWFRRAVGVAGGFSGSPEEKIPFWELGRFGCREAVEVVCSPWGTLDGFVEVFVWW